jgi:methyl-accepting chemotaxis protein
MFRRLLAFFLLIGIIYILGVFFVPWIADQYWNNEINIQIRNLKKESSYFATGSESLWSIVDRILHTGNTLVDETKKTTENIQTTITEKSEQTKEVIDSMNHLYDTVKETQKDIQNLTTFTGIHQ